jgi:THO complex subunit 3
VATSGENINIAWSPDGLHVATGDRSDCITVLDVRTHRSLGSTKFDFEVNEFCWDRTGSLFFVTSGAGPVEVLAYPSWQARHSLVAHTGGCYCLALSPQGNQLAVGSADALVSLWDLDELLLVRTLGRLDKPVRSLSYSHCGRFLAAGSQDGFVDIALTSSGEQAHRLETRAELNSLAWNPRFLLLAYAVGDEYGRTEDGLTSERSGSSGGSLRLWGVGG